MSTTTQTTPRTTPDPETERAPAAEGFSGEPAGEAVVDVIDLLAGTTPDSPLSRTRAQRPRARENAQRSFEALLEPADPGSFSHTERYAVATFTAHLHRFEHAARFYADVLSDTAPHLLDPIHHAARDAASTGPAGTYREPGLSAESVPTTAWTPSPALAAQLGPRLSAALTHTHLLVFRPREAGPAALRDLLRAGWSADHVVSLSQLVAFLTFQLRTAWGLAVLRSPHHHEAGRGVSGTTRHEPTGSGEPAGPQPGAHDHGPQTHLDLVTEHPDLHRPERFTQQSLGWVPWLEPVAEDDLTDAQREALVEPARAKMPYFRLLARDPDALRARTLTDLDIFFNTTGGIGRAERELAAAATSRRNGCVFCAHVHAAAATRESGRGQDVQRLLDDGPSADLGDERWNAIVAASVHLADTPLAFNGDDVDRLRSAGLDDTAIVDVVNGAAFFNWANRLMLSLGEPEVPASRRREPA
ncbi:alkylhydroperoxidase domain protein [Kineococcus radiotolerans]|uniref:Uncharacterized peroxidase-related enzyme n=1 Tax=Kineococcus radiotolerans (strain ATCC BAA-149 / DSM 14245 / SRS30216) TaxID=266940 RepID=A6WBM7_KINRD|nr:alkylhydroperoxidase domain protein [Kineococcus radiotolerans]ABS04216.1 uncharacterized peroxidase-related enzyme [Kineococcus radiotolerans SRS30216 = ATCC BAA-149]